METVATPGIVAAELVERFRRDGFVVVPDLLTDAEVDAYGAAVTAAVRERTAGDDRPLEERSRYEQSFTQCMNLWEDRLDVRPLTFHPRLGQAAAELLGIDAIRVWHDQALFKRSGGRPTDAHQDHPYWPMKRRPPSRRGCRSTGTTLASGSLAFLPGSHRVGLRKFVNIFFGEPEDILADPDWRTSSRCSSRSRRARCRSTTASPSTSPRPTAPTANGPVHTVIYFADGNTRGYPYPHFAVDRAGIELGQPIASDVTPIAWPRLDGDLPPTPTETIEAPAVVVTNPGSVPPAR